MYLGCGKVKKHVKTKDIGKCMEFYFDQNVTTLYYFLVIQLGPIYTERKQ